MNKFKKIYCIWFKGGFGQENDFKSKKSSFLESVDQPKTRLQKILYNFDSWFLFNGRKIRTKAGRVRSKKEQKIVAYFDEMGVKYKYEKSLGLYKEPLHSSSSQIFWVKFWCFLVDIVPSTFRLREFCFSILKHFLKKKRIVLCRPDFYLPKQKISLLNQKISLKQGVWVEFWGLAGAKGFDNYRRIMKAKQRLFDSNDICWIDLYPGQMGKISEVFPELLKKI